MVFIAKYLQEQAHTRVFALVLFVAAAGHRHIVTLAKVRFICLTKLFLVIFSRSTLDSLVRIHLNC